MAIELLEGQCIGLDSHLSDLLDLYTRERNTWVRTQLQRDYPGEEGRPEPEDVSSEELGRELIRVALHQWLYGGVQ